MAPASESRPSRFRQGGKSSGAGVVPSFVLVLALACAACNDDGEAHGTTAVPTAAVPSVADPAIGMTTELDGIAPEFGDAVIAELAGDEKSARAAFERVLVAPDAAAPIAARAALHLAQLDARAGESRRALDYSARAAALAPNDAAITEGVAQVQADIVAASGGGDLRGPKAGKPLPGVDPKLAEAFAAAERTLVRVHTIRARGRLELWAKEDATEEAVAKYRAIRDKAPDGSVARVACDYRIGSLYHDLALGDLFGGASELRARALAYLRSAVAAYRASLAGSQAADAELWRLAAETDLRNARDVLAAAGAGD